MFSFHNSDVLRTLRESRKVAIEKYLNDNSDVLRRLRDSRQRSKREGMKDEYKDKATAKDIAKCLFCYTL